MSLWRRTSAEMAGLWRSVRYDLGRRPSEPLAGGPDVTSTGMNTFGGPGWDFGSASIELPVAGPAPGRPPRRAALVSTFGLLTVIGAAGAYLVVVNGLVPLREEKPAAAGTFRPVPPAVVTADSGIGPSTPLPRRRPAAPRAGGGEPSAVSPVPDRPAPRHARPVRTVKRSGPGGPAGSACKCAGPPVPTPTAPTSSPSATPPVPVRPTGSASTSPSAPDDSDIPVITSEPGGGRRAWRHRHFH